MQLIYAGRLDDEFDGFDDEKVFTFSNGQQWQQARYKYKYHYKYRPMAKIWRDGGRHFLQVDCLNEMIEVRKI